MPPMRWQWMPAKFVADEFRLFYHIHGHGHSCDCLPDNQRLSQVELFRRHLLGQLEHSATPTDPHLPATLHTYQEMEFDRCPAMPKWCKCSTIRINTQQLSTIKWKINENYGDSYRKESEFIQSRIHLCEITMSAKKLRLKLESTFFRSPFLPRTRWGWVLSTVTGQLFKFQVSHQVEPQQNERNMNKLCILIQLWSRNYLLFYVWAVNSRTSIGTWRCLFERIFNELVSGASNMAGPSSSILKYE